MAPGDNDPANDQLTEEINYVNIDGQGTEGHSGEGQRTPSLNMNLDEIEASLFASMTKKEKIEWLKEKREREDRRTQFMLELESRERMAAMAASQVQTRHVNQTDKDVDFYAKKLKYSVPKMPEVVTNMPGWFKTFEGMCIVDEVPKTLWGRLVIPFLSETAKVVLMRIEGDKLTDYTTLKTAILEEFKLAPSEYLKQFLESRKERKETWFQYISRLRDLLDYYWKAKKVNSLEKALELSVADQFKRMLPQAAREHVVLQEGIEVKGLDELAKVVQQWEDSRVPNPFNSNENVENRRSSVTSNNHRIHKGNEPVQTSRVPQTQNKNTLGKPRRMVVCHLCKKPGHFMRECRQNPEGLKEAKIRRVVSQEENTMSGQGQSPDDLARPSTSSSGNDQADSLVVAKVTCPLGIIKDRLARKSSNVSQVDITVGNTETRAILDTGADITVVHAELAEACNVSLEGGQRVKLIGAFGNSVVANLVELPIALKNQDATGASMVNIICAVTDKLQGGTKCLLNPEDLQILENAVVVDKWEKKSAYERLGEIATEIEEDEQKEAGLNEQTLGTNETWLVNRLIGDEFLIDERESELNAEQQWVTNLVREELLDNDGDNGESETDKLIKDQANDQSLKQAWADARAHKNGMEVKHGILLHNETIGSTKVKQVVVPKNRRDEILKCAHDSPWGGHLGSRKTAQRIRLSFYWPGMVEEIRKYVQSCHSCQVRARPRTNDRIPITPITRPEVAFQIVNMDVVGPIDPPSSRGHQYLLCLVDLGTRWPEVVCLKSLSAKATCDALLEIFSRTGLPEEVKLNEGWSPGWLQSKGTM